MVKTADNPIQSRGVKGFFKNNIFVIIAFILPAVLMGIGFLISKFMPFGDNMIMVADSWHQYFPFLTELQRMLKAGEMPLYSWNLGGGSSFVGVLGNYLASPLYLFTYFLPEGHIWLVMYLAFTVLLRIGCAGGFMAIFLRKVFKRNDLSLVYFSLMYALCGYIQGYYWNMMWLDTIALMPLVIAGVVSVLKDGKYSLYVISLALSVIFSFYIGYFVCLFVLLFSICYTIVNFVSIKHSFKNAGKMLGYTLVAFMLTAFMTVPVYMALSHSDSSADAQGFPLEYSINYAYGYESNSIINTIKAIVRTVTNLISFTRPIRMDKGEPNIFCGALSLVLVVFYITAKNIKLKEKIVSVSLLVFFILSFVVNQLNYIWHGMNTPAMVYYRFSFIFSFVLVVLAYRAFCQIDYFGKKSFIAATGILVLYLAAAFIFQRKLSVAITAAAAAVLMVGFLLYRKGKLKYRVLSVLLCIFVVCEMGLSAVYAVRVVGFSDSTDFPKEEAAVDALTGIAAEQSGDELYRTEFLYPYSLNDGALYSAYGISTFNSMCRSDYTDLLAEMGLSASEINNRYVYYESTPVVNLFLNIKYLIARGEVEISDKLSEIIEPFTEEPVNDKYVKQIATADESVLYENTAYIPMGFMTNTELLNYKLHDTSQLPVDTQNQMFSMATGIDSNVLTALKPTSVSEVKNFTLTTKDNLDYYYTYERQESTEDEVLTVEYEISDSGSYYGMFTATDENNIRYSVNGKNAVTMSEFIYIVPLGDCESGDTIEVELPLTQDKGYAISYVFSMNDEVFLEGLDKLDDSVMKITEQSSRGFKGTINAQSDGLFYTSVFYDEGWRAYVDSKEVEITPVADVFCAFELSEGQHEIEFKFMTEGLFTGIAVTAAGLAVFALLGLFTVKYRKKKAAKVADCCISDTNAADADTQTDISPSDTNE